MSSQLWFTTKWQKEFFKTSFRISFQPKAKVLMMPSKADPVSVFLEVFTWITSHHSHLSISYKFHAHSHLMPLYYCQFFQQCPLPRYSHGKQPHPLRILVHVQFVFSVRLSWSPFLKFQPSPLLPWPALMIHFTLLYFLTFW